MCAGEALENTLHLIIFIPPTWHGPTPTQAERDSAMLNRTSLGLEEKYAFFS